MTRLARSHPALLALLPCALALALAGCGEPSDTAAGTDPQARPMPVEPDGGMGDGAAPLPDMEAQADTIPAALFGRWGMTPGDCTDAHGDAKGAIQISARQLRFYEARATLGPIAERSETAIRATYDFAGEGQEWTRDIALALSADRRQLTRSEFGADALATPETYTKCPF